MTLESLHNAAISLVEAYGKLGSYLRVNHKDWCTYLTLLSLGDREVSLLCVPDQSYHRYANKWIVGARFWDSLIVPDEFVGEGILVDGTDNRKIARLY